MSVDGIEPPMPEAAVLQTAGNPFPNTDLAYVFLSLRCCENVQTQSGWQDLNLRLLESESSTLTKLSYILIEGSSAGESHLQALSG